MAGVSGRWQLCGVFCMTEAGLQRQCGTCTLCCKILTVPEFGNPTGVWCPHCVKAKGCAIHAIRPDVCRAFQCGYIPSPALEEHWRPSRSKLIIAFKPDGKEVVIHVDPDVPNAWRAEPYYSEIRNMAANGPKMGATIFVQIGRRMIAVFPDREVDLGVVAEDEAVAIQKEPGTGRLGAVKLKANDPRIV